MDGKALFKKKRRFFQIAWVSYLLVALPLMMVFPRLAIPLVVLGMPLIIPMLALRCPGCGARLFSNMGNVDPKHGAIEWRRKWLIFYEPVRHRTCGADLN